MAVRFTVTEKFDLASREGVLVVGRCAGDIVAGITLRTGDGEAVRVIGVELLSPANERDGTVTIVIERDDAGRVSPGDVLVADTPVGSEDPAVAAMKRELAFDPEDFARAKEKVDRREAERTRRIFGDREPFPYPDSDTDA